MTKGEPLPPTPKPGQKHGKFTQGTTLQAMADENAVQRWIGDRLEAMRRQSYSIERETHGAEEKEPDITLTSMASGVTLPIEIKVVDKMSVAEMERALFKQLCGQYLRHRDSRHGILLLVHKVARRNGWRLKGSSQFVPLERILAHLEEMATVIRSIAFDAPQPIVVCMDVSALPSLTRKVPSARSTSRRGKAARS